MRRATVLTVVTSLPNVNYKMSSDSPVKHFVLAFLIALVVYLVLYRIIEDRRKRTGPWEVTFTNSLAGAPEIVINQPKLAITNVQISFTEDSMPGADVVEALPFRQPRPDSLITNRPSPISAPITLVFNQPRPVPYDVPFGKCIFMDATFLPGTVTFQLFGHQIELLPRVLIIDQQEEPWRAEAVISLRRARDSHGQPEP